MDTGAAIASLRELGADRLDPVRFRFVEALARRAANYQGDARRLLEAKLARALKEYGARLERNQQTPAPDGANLEQSRSVECAGPLAGLVATLEEQSGRECPDHLPSHSTQPQGSSTASAQDGGTSGRPNAELKSLRYFRDTWSKLSVEYQLAQALAQGPENAGPLNAHLLVLESLKLMRDLSPDYLNRFMSYVDALLWLDQANGSRTPVAKDVPREEGGKKRKSSRTRQN